MTKLVMALITMLALVGIPLLSACAQAPTPTAAPAPTKAPAEAPKAEATKPAAAPTKAPEAAKPAEPAKPAAATKVSYPKLNLKASHYLETSHSSHTSAVFFANRVKELSGGQINITIYPGESLIRGRDNAMALRGGIVDLGLITTNFYAGEFPIWFAISTLPFAWRMDNFLAGFEELRPVIAEEYAKNNMEILFPVTAQLELFTNFEIDLSNPSLKGKKMRAPGGAANDLVVGLGGDNVAMSSAELPTAVQTKLIDGFVTSLMSWYGLGLMQGANHAYVMNLEVPMGFTWAANRDKWRSWPKEVQDLFKQVSIEAAKQMIVDTNEANETIFKIADAQKDKVFIHRPTPTQLKSWKDRSLPIYDDMTKKYPKEMSAFRAALTKFP